VPRLPIPGSDDDTWGDILNEFLEVAHQPDDPGGGTLKSSAVNAAGAVMNSDTATSDMGFVVDEDDMASNSATKLPTQQSTKAYIDSGLASKRGTSAQKNSIESNAGDLQLVGDTASPGNSKVYGTNGSGTRGWYSAAGGGSWGSITGTLSAQTDLQSALDAKAAAANAKGFVNHGSTASTARPTGYASIEWYGTVEPTNMANGDTWIVA
jgi:hypothetical protein